MPRGMVKAIGFVCVPLCSLLLGYAASLYLPPAIAWINYRLLDSVLAGLLLIVVIPLFGALLFLATIPIGIAALLFKWNNSKFMAVTSAVCCAGPAAVVLMFSDSTNTIVGPGFVGVGWIMFVVGPLVAGPLLNILVFPAKEKPNSSPESCNGLARPGWLAKDNSEKQLKRIAKIKEQQHLLPAVAYSPFDSVRKAALEKMTDEDMLVSAIKAVAGAGCNARLRKADYRILEMAVRKISNQKMLADVVLNEKTKDGDLRDMRLAALAKISDPELLADIMRTTTCGFVRYNAVRKIDDQDLLASLARNEKDTMVRNEAVKRLRDQDILWEIAKSDQHTHQENWSALQRLTDQDILVDVATKAASPQIRAEAAEKIEDVATREQILHGEAHDLARRMMCEKLGGHKVRDCRCSRCGAEVHDFQHQGTTQEQISRIAALEIRTYRCRHCGKVKEERVGGGID